MSKYLYQKLLIKPYPKHQYMDEESVDWLKNNLNIKYSNSDVKKIINKLKKFPIDELKINKKFYIKYNGLGIHGVRHQIRVAIYIWIIIEYYNINIPHEMVIQLLQAALYHDLMRKNDNADIKHGVNSALFIKKEYPDIDSIIINAVVNHDKIIDDYSIYDKLLKTADALDRYRLPKEKWWVKKEYLLMDLDEEIFELCKYITYFIEKNTCNLNDCEKIIEELVRCMKVIDII